MMFGDEFELEAALGSSFSRVAVGVEFSGFFGPPLSFLGCLDGESVPSGVYQYISLENIYKWHEAVHGVYAVFQLLQDVYSLRVCRVCHFLVFSPCRGILQVISLASHHLSTNSESRCLEVGPVCW
jgi:hypothetical protein